jgi:oligoribonuclease (3'-5' exoribonuclease)
MPLLTVGNTVYPEDVPKVLISMPEDLLRQLDEAAQTRGETRSGFIQRITEHEIVESNAQLRKELEELFASHSVDLGGNSAAELVRQGRDHR